MNSDLNRSANFEKFEPRLVMSAQALSDFVADFNIDMPEIDVDQQIEALMAGGENGQSSANDIQSIRDQYNLNGAGQTVAVIDSGIAFDHAALGGGLGENFRVVGGYDFAENDSNPYDDGPLGLHGTHVAGIIGGASDEFAGVAPEVDLVSLRVFDDNGAGEMAWVEQALQWVHDNRNAFENPITTVNLSLGTDWNADNVPDAAHLEDEFAQLEADGIFISVAAGNLFQSYNDVGVSYPAASPYVVPVASYGADGMVSDFSQRNDRVLVAPGESILSTVPDHIFGGSQTDGYLRTTGTSQSAPFIAGASALLREAFQNSGQQNIDQDMLYDHFVATSDVIHDDVTGYNYHKVNLERAIAAAIGDDHGNHHSTSTNVGALTGGEIVSGVIESTGDSDHFLFRADSTGTIRLNVNASAGLTPQIGADGATQNGNEISFDVVAGNHYRFSIGSSSGTGNYQIQVSIDNVPVTSSPVSVTNGRLVVNGTSGNDDIQFNQGSMLEIVVNGENFQFNPNQVSEVLIIGAGGYDSIDTSFTGEIDRAVLQENRLDVYGPTLDFTARGFEHINIDGGENANRLIARDSDSQDVFAADFNSVTVTGDGFQNTASGFRHVVMNASDGFDRVTITGSNGDDRFIANDGRNVMRHGSQRIVANEFEIVSVAGSGGEDFATLRDSVANDLFELTGRAMHVATTEYDIWGSGFERITAESSTGYDSVVFNATGGQDKLIHRDERTRFSGNEYLNVASGFEHTVVNANSDQDSARIFDTVGNDIFESNGANTRFESTNQIIRSNGFNSVEIVGGAGGYDIATLVGTHGIDTVSATANSTSLMNSSGIEVDVNHFEHVTVDTLGGYDTTNLIGGNQRDLLRSISNRLEFESTVQMLRIVNAESTQFEGNGGVDEVIFSDFDSLDLLQAMGDNATAYLGSQQINVSGIEFLDARVRAGETGFYDIDAVDFLFLLDGNWQEND